MTTPSVQDLWRDTPRRRKLTLGVVGAVVLIVVIGTVGFVSCGRDEEAYRDGQQTAWQAEMLMKVMQETRAEERDAADVPDADWADTPEKACLKVYRTSRSEVRKMDQGDWVQGCMDQIRDHPGVLPWEERKKQKAAKTTVPTTVIYDPSTVTPTYTPTPNYAPPVAAPPTTEDASNPTTRTILKLQWGDCLQRVQGKQYADGTYQVFVYAAACDNPLATDRVVRTAYGQPPCPDWVRTSDVTPPRVLCLEKLR
ncbi:hypothetical protein [Mycolicibacterium mucogenicum]|nr:hypothetical protein [Mycolicibacterium mucogenicum]